MNVVFDLDLAKPAPLLRDILVKADWQANEDGTVWWSPNPADAWLLMANEPNGRTTRIVQTPIAQPLRCGVTAHKSEGLSLCEQFLSANPTACVVVHQNVYFGMQHDNQREWWQISMDAAHE